MVLFAPRPCARLLAPAVLLSALLVSEGASAQSITLAATGVGRQTPKPDRNKPFGINYQDCIDDDALEVRPQVTGGSGYTLQAWVGSGCTEKTQRQGDAASCFLVYSAESTTEFPTIIVRAQDIAAQKTNIAVGAAGSADQQACLDFSGQRDVIKSTLWLFLMDSNNEVLNVADTQNQYSLEYDFLGPLAPTNVSAGVGEERVIVDFNGSESSDRAGYRFYCQQAGATTADAGTPDSSAGTGGTGGSGAAGTAGATGASGAAGAAGAAGATGAAGASSDAGTAGTSGTGGGAATNPACPSTALIPGEVPDPAYLCGEVTGATTTTGAAKGLQNGVTYAVAVAAVDTFENSGPLSEVVCGTPAEITDFFEAYREAGGDAGGGFCSISRQPAPLAGLLFAAAGALSMLRRRRRR